MPTPFTAYGSAGFTFLRCADLLIRFKLLLPVVDNVAGEIVMHQVGVHVVHGNVTCVAAEVLKRSVKFCKDTSTFAILILTSAAAVVFVIYSQSTIGCSSSILE